MACPCSRHQKHLQPEYISKVKSLTISLFHYLSSPTTHLVYSEVKGENM